MHICRQMASGKNLSSVEMMRGIAAFMVAYFHIARGNARFLDHDSFFFTVGKWGWAGVEIFFVISGFIITYAMFHGNYTLGRVHKFLAKRLVRLEPPYIVSIVVVLVLMYVSTLSPYYRGKPFNPDWGNVLGHLGYVNAFTGANWLQDVYWTLAVEFEFYIGLALLFPLLTFKKKAVSWLTLAGIAAMSFIPAGDAHVFEYLSFFLMGIILSLYMVGYFQRKEFVLFIVLSVLLCVYAQSLILCSLGVVTVLAILFIKSVPGPLKWMGKISYSLYLLHIPIGGRIINITEAKIQNQDIRIVVVFVALAVCLVCSHFFYKWVEKPFQRISKKISY